MISYFSKPFGRFAGRCRQVRLRLAFRLVVGMLVCCLGILSAAVSAVEQGAPADTDVRLLIDISGSMQRTDPNNLRIPAVHLLLDLLPDNSRAGVWTFGRYVNLLVPHTTVNQAWRDTARAKASEIQSVALHTNIGGVLEEAIYDAGRSAPGRNTHIILLTDGMVDIARDPAINQREWRRIVDELLPRIQQTGYKLHTIALSDEADKELMEKLALATDGVAAVARTAEELLKIFVTIFDQAAPAQQVPLTGNRFLVDSRVSELTALLFRQPGAQDTQVVGPDNEVLTADTRSEFVRWVKTDAYDLITIRHPYEGEWQIHAALEADSRITVVSDLALRVRSLPSNLFRGAEGEVLQFALQEGGVNVTQRAFLQLLDQQVERRFGAEESVLQADWSHKIPRDALPTDGTFRVSLPAFDRMGVYDLHLSIDGQTFQRQFRHRFTVREPFTAELDEVVDDLGVLRQRLLVRAHGDHIDPGTTQIAATVTNPARRRLVRPLELTPHDRWQTFIPTEAPGDYRVVVRVTGVDTQKRPFEYELMPLVLTYNPDGAFTPVAPEPPAPPAAVPDAPRADVAPAPVPPPEAPVEPAEEAPAAIPNWLFYTGLLLGNVVVIGAGYWLFRRLMDDDDAAPEPAAETSAQTPASPAKTPHMAPAFDDDMLQMDSGDDDEAEPPMEDLDAEGFDSAAVMPVPARPPRPEDEALRETLVQQVVGDGSPEEQRSFAEEVLKAQGLDLDEDELDDAISNLIGELDGKRATQDAEPDDWGDLDDDDPKR